MNQDQSPNTVPPPRRFQRLAGYFIKAVLPLIVLALALIGAKVMMDTAPTAPRQPKVRQAKLVDVVQLDRSAQPVMIDTAMGVVKPAQSVELKPQVAGRVEWLAPSAEPGSSYAAGEPLLRVEAVDYELALKRQQSAVLTARANIDTAKAALVTAQNNLAVEMGNQRVSQREFELLGETIDEDSRDLVLRVPQLKAAEAAVQSAEAAVESAEAALASAKSQLETTQLDLTRTQVTTPFNAVIAQKWADVGDVVGTTTPLFTLYGTDEFWVELSIPSSQLKWVRVGESGSQVTLSNPIAWGSGQTRTGRVIRVLPEVDADGRMARVLVSVKDPLARLPENRGKPQLWVNDFLNATIQGAAASDVIALSRQWLREGDTVWIMNTDNTLEIRQVQPLYRGRDVVLIKSGLSSQDRIITTDISAPVEGLLLRLDAQTTPEAVPGSEKQEEPAS